MRRTFLIGALVPLAMLGCTRAEIVDIDDGGGRMDAGRDDAGDVRDAGTDAGTGCVYAPVDTTGMPAGCVVRRPPPRPTCDAPPPSGAELIFAVRAVSLTPASTEGLDLDGWCTASSVSESSCVPTGSLSPDAVEGIDNSFGTGFAATLRAVYMSGFGTNFDDAVTASNEQGFGNLTLRLRDWNGEPDDQNVALTFATSVCGGAAGAPASCPASPTGVSLDWTRDDNVFFPIEEQFTGGDPEMPRIFDLSAYVSGGTLVARLPDAAALALATANGSFTVTLRDTYVIADLDPDGGGISFGIIAGKWPGVDAIQAGFAFGACPGTPGGDFYGGAVSNALDIVADGPGGAGVPCDAISLAISFTATRATWGPMVPGRPPSDLCP